MFRVEDNYADIKPVLAWQEGAAHYKIYWGNKAARLQTFKRELMIYLNTEFGHNYKFRATVLRHCTALGVHVMDSNSGYMFQVIQTLRT